MRGQFVPEASKKNIYSNFFSPGVRSISTLAKYFKSSLFIHRREWLVGWLTLDSLTLSTLLISVRFLSLSLPFCQCCPNVLFSLSVAGRTDGWPTSDLKSTSGKIILGPKHYRLHFLK